MTSTTDELATTIGGRRGRLLRFVAAFVAGAALAGAIGTAVVLAFESRYAGLALPGVSVGSVAVAGLDGPTIATRLRGTYGSLAEGTLIVDAPGGAVSVTFEELGREIDADRLAAEALALGRIGNPIERVVAEARLLVRGRTIPARATLDPGRLDGVLRSLAERDGRPAIDASILATPIGYVTSRGVVGRSLDVASIEAATRTALAALDAPSELRIVLPAVPVVPAVDNMEATRAASAANLMARDVTLALDGDSWRIGARTVRRWIAFAPTADGSIGPVLDRAAIELNLKTIARKLVVEPVDARFLFGKDGAVVGVEPSVTGRALDIPGTARLVEASLIARTDPLHGAPAIRPALISTRPTLTTAEATKVAPEMTLISTWTTYFPIGIKNGFGANIEVPTNLIDGTVVASRSTFDFWKVVGDPAADGGYKLGGAIINGRTEPQGALAGGICSCSTTIFNAALRAGYAMGARMNHYYYIDRYPLGLDATVWISSATARQTMSWTNDTDYPVLIRGSVKRVGSKGYVTFELWSAPTGRTVEFSTPIVKNVRPATTVTEETDELPPGEREQVEWPADGKDVWVTRTVRDRDGLVIHTETYYSHYARVDGVIRIGVAPGTGPGVGTPPTPPPPPVSEPLPPVGDPAPDPVLDPAA